MSERYKKTSPYFATPETKEYLDHFVIRPILAEADDIYFTITPSYHLRPDLLSYDLYGTAKLWWVFAQRNMNVLLDPVFDFKAGTQIYLPKKSRLQYSLGL